jgi:hypothetical protein
MGGGSGELAGHTGVVGVPSRVNGTVAGWWRPAEVPGGDFFPFLFSKIGITTSFENLGGGVSHHRHLVHNGF